MEVEIGTIVGTHGIKGEVKIYSTTDFADERYQPGNFLTLRSEHQEIRLEIESHRYHKKIDLIKFVGLNNINDVEQYRGMHVYANQSEELADGEFYYQDLIGCAIVDENGQNLGHVISILQMPTQDILEVEDDNGTYMIPYVDAFIVEEKITEKEIVVSLIQGMRP